MTFDPSSILGAVFWGVVAGIVTSAILLVAGLVFTKILIPWYLRLIFRGVDLSGDWIYQCDWNGNHYNYHLVLEQSAHDISGSMTIARTNLAQNTGKDYSQGFAVSGTTWEGFVTLNMRSSDRRSLSYATSLLQIIDRGQTLDGQLVYRTTGADQVASERIKFSRSKT